MGNLYSHEKSKYNLIHKHTGLSETQIGYGRQIKELLSEDFPFHLKWRELIEGNNKFLEVGIGAGEILRFFHSKDIDYWGIDISDYVVNELSQEGLKVKECSCHDILFPDNYFDVVTHLDGMEHIPEEWEVATLEEEIRVSKKYIMHANAMGDAYLDSVSIRGGFDALHVNIKTEQEWDFFYEKNASLMDYEIIFRESKNGTYYIIIEKKWK